LLFLIAVLLPLLPARGGTRPQRDTPWASLADAFGGSSACQPHAAHVFRLGSAAQPFGWSTAIGDFNTDGTPDVVVADHTSHRAGLYSYRIQFAVSGLSAGTFAFESPQSAVTVKVSDVDHDNDLDVVVHSAASPEVVAVWLNDGHGRFRPADKRQFGPTVQSLTSIDTGGRGAQAETASLSSRRAPDVLSLLAPALSRPSVERVGRSIRIVQSRLRSAADSPRGPPVLPA
jgi:hypothetical protein